MVTPARCAATWISVYSISLRESSATRSPRSSPLARNACASRSARASTSAKVSERSSWIRHVRSGKRRTAFARRSGTFTTAPSVPRLAPLVGAAVDVDHLAGDVAGLLRSEPRHRGADLARLAEPPDGDVREDGRKRLLRRVHGCGGHQPGCDRVERDAGLRDLERDVAQEAVH